MKAVRDEARTARLAKESKDTPTLDVLADDDELDRFAADGDNRGIRPARRGWPSSQPPSVAASQPGLKQRTLLVAALAFVLAAAVVYLQFYPLAPAASNPSAAATGEVTVDSNPAGAQVSVDGVAKGGTPLVLTLPAGDHVLELVLGDARRQRTLTLRAGAVASHFVEFSGPGPSVPASDSPVATTGRLEVTSDRPGAAVRVDGQRLGVTPLLLDAVRAGERRVTVGEGPGAIERVVRVAPNSTASMVATLGSTATSAGWVAIAAPFEMQIAEGQVLLGTTSAPRTMLPAGRHELQLTNDALNFRTSVVVTVQPGGTASATVNAPQSTLSVNATPWAEVSIDGRPYGPTPIGNISLSIGTHEVVWKHPTYGERRQAAIVKVGAPTRVAVDFSKP